MADFAPLASDLPAPKPTGLAFPDESQCPTCGYFDVTHPDVMRILQGRRDLGNFGMALTQARCKCATLEAQQQAKTNLRYQQANLPTGARGERTFDSFQVTPDTRAMNEAARRFAMGEGPNILTLKGPKGVGKSHHLEAIIRQCLDRGLTARYEVAAELLDRLRATYEDDTEEDLAGLLDWYHGFHVLALDEIGLTRASAWAQEQLYKLVDYRLRYGRRLVVASMRSTEEIAESAGEALASRICGTREDLGEVALITTVAPDYRSVTT